MTSPLASEAGLSKKSHSLSQDLARDFLCQRCARGWEPRGGAAAVYVLKELMDAGKKQKDSTNKTEQHSCLTLEKYMWESVELKSNNA